jgi:WD40 repeat protein
MVAGSSDVQVELWDIRKSWNYTHELRDEGVVSQYSRTIAFSPDGNTVAIANRTIKFWDLQANKIRQELGCGFQDRASSIRDNYEPQNTKLFRSISWASNGRTLAAGWSKEVQIWDV